MTCEAYSRAVTYSDIHVFVCDDSGHLVDHDLVKCKSDELILSLYEMHLPGGSGDTEVFQRCWRRLYRTRKTTT
jgi:hypothetical protein